MTASSPCLEAPGRLRRIRVGACIAVLAALAACSGPPPPPITVPVPPLPVPEPIPARPLPPSGASANVPIPPMGADGLRVSVNRNISPAQSIWNLRSAWNVAALDCSETTYPDIAPAYRDFLKKFAKGLKATNRKVDTEFRAKYGAKYVAQREAFMTQVYNHDALPPTLDEFCKAISAVGRDAVTVKPVELEQFAVRSLPSIEIVFDVFYRHYKLYQDDRAAWEARYGSHDAAPVASTDAAGPVNSAGK